MADLKPCPFCGGDAGCNRRSGDERDGYADLVTIFCTGCGVRVAASGDTSKGGYADNSTVYERAIGAWNRRAASPADQGEDARQLVTERMVQSALEAGWNEFVSDTGCYPACFEVQRGKRIEADFQRAEGAFLEYIAASLNAAMSASKEGA